MKQVDMLISLFIAFTQSSNLNEVIHSKKSIKGLLNFLLSKKESAIRNVLNFFKFTMFYNLSKFHSKKMLLKGTKKKRENPMRGSHHFR